MRSRVRAGSDVGPCGDAGSGPGHGNDEARGRELVVCLDNSAACHSQLGGEHPRRREGVTDPQVTEPYLLDDRFRNAVSQRSLPVGHDQRQVDGRRYAWHVCP